ncbi:MAG: hypothetical protein CME70_04520 [Halobacteriovorax sp.]|nr:hypothetical protein [Halobacteriovorax sp.]|tara:strand:+ start:5522 stop:6037 length:516 start_codon:yes stop_codon:yes gene_type:complete
MSEKPIFESNYGYMKNAGWLIMVMFVGSGAFMIFFGLNAEADWLSLFGIIFILLGLSIWIPSFKKRYFKVFDDRIETYKSVFSFDEVTIKFEDINRIEIGKLGYHGLIRIHNKVCKPFDITSMHVGEVKISDNLVNELNFGRLGWFNYYIYLTLFLLFGVVSRFGKYFYDK